MNQSNETFKIPESEQDLTKILVKKEMQRTLSYLGCVVFLLGLLGLIHYVINSEFIINKFYIFLAIMMLWMPTLQIIFVRIGNVIGGHKFYKPWLIFPIVNIIVILWLSTYLVAEIADQSSINVFFKLMVCLTFINSAFTASRGEKNEYDKSLIINNERIVFLEKKKWWIYRIMFSSLSFLSLSLVSL